jgi:hypothetical protein
MNGYFEQVLRQLEAGLATIENESNLIRRLTGSLRLVKEAIAGLKRELHVRPFAGKEDEILYFKDQAPVIYSRLFFFMKLYLIESNRAHMSRERFQVRLQEEMQRVEEFYTQHREILLYTQRDGSFWDESLYTRRGSGEWWAEEEGLFIDKDFTIGSYWMAKNRANEKLMRWLSEQMENLDKPAKTEDHPERRKAGLLWTAKQVDLVELVYALHEVGCFNNGKATLKETMEGFESFLGIAVGQYHITLQEIARRKINPVKFLDQLKEGLKKKLDGMA